MSQDGQFLHYIFPYQFMDSPEWESLHPSEEGTFQVTRSSMAALLTCRCTPQHRCLPLSHLPSVEKECLGSGFGEQERVVLVPKGSHVAHVPTNLPKGLENKKKKLKSPSYKGSWKLLAPSGCSSSSPGLQCLFYLCQTLVPVYLDPAMASLSKTQFHF